MSTLTAGRLRIDRQRGDTLLACLLFVIWAIPSVALRLHLVAAPRGAVFIQLVLLLLLPGTLVLRLLISRRPAGHVIGPATGLIAIGAMALILAPALARSPLVALLPLAIVIPGVIVARFPAAATILTFAASGTYGTVEAYTGVSASALADTAVTGLWVALIGGLLFKQRREAYVLTPGVLAVCAFIALSVVVMPFAPEQQDAFNTLRLSVFHMSVFLVIAYWAWTPRAEDRIVKAILLVALVVGAYATLRWAIGPGAKEEDLITAGGDGARYNKLEGGDDKVQGSLPNGQELGLWTSIVLPFCVASALALRGWVRLVAALAVPFCLIGLLGSGQRTGVIAVVAGVLVVLVLNQAARAFPGARLGTAGAAIVALMVCGAFLFAAVADTPEKAERYRSILTPGQDYPLQERLFKWSNAFADIDGYPFGRGLGTTGSGSGDLQRFSGNAAHEVDNSYVAIAYEQGTWVMIFFILALALVLMGLVRAAIWSKVRSSAILAIGASGTLTAVMIEFVGNLFLRRTGMLAAWVIIGLGIAQTATRHERERRADAKAA